eukprot:UN08732
MLIECSCHTFNCIYFKYQPYLHTNYHIGHSFFGFASSSIYDFISVSFDDTSINFQNFLI